MATRKSDKINHLKYWEFGNIRSEVESSGCGVSPPGPSVSDEDSADLVLPGS